jgi:hypothetical protein
MDKVFADKKGSRYPNEWENINIFALIEIEIVN